MIHLRLYGTRPVHSHPDGTACQWEPVAAAVELTFWDARGRQVTVSITPDEAKRLASKLLVDAYRVEDLTRVWQGSST